MSFEQLRFKSHRLVLTFYTLQKWHLLLVKSPVVCLSLLFCALRLKPAARLSLEEQLMVLSRGLKVNMAVACLPRSGSASLSPRLWLAGKHTAMDQEASGRPQPPTATGSIPRLENDTLSVVFPFDSHNQRQIKVTGANAQRRNPHEELPKPWRASFNVSVSRFTRSVSVVFLPRLETTWNSEAQNWRSDNGDAAAAAAAEWREVHWGRGKRKIVFHKVCFSVNPLAAVEEELQASGWSV